MSDKNFFVAPEECNATGVRFLDTCSVHVAQSTLWPVAWADCKARGGRLMEIPDSKYNSAYFALNSQYFAVALDNRWLGFMRNNSASSIRYWLHGPFSETMTWSDKIIKESVQECPCFGVITKISSKVVWLEYSIQASQTLQYFCQFPIGKMNNTQLTSDFSKLVEVCIWCHIPLCICTQIQVIATGLILVCAADIVWSVVWLNLLLYLRSLLIF